MLQLQRWSKETIFRGQGRDQGQEKKFQAKDRIFEDKCTREEIEAGVESDFVTFWMERSGV